MGMVKARARSAERTGAPIAWYCRCCLGLTEFPRERESYRRSNGLSGLRVVFRMLAELLHSVP
jgi:hypothetical protein